MDKAAIRKAYMEMRKALSDEKRSALSVSITNQVLFFLKSRPTIRHVHIFLSIKRLKEIDTFPLLVALQAEGYQVYTSSLSPFGDKLDTLNISDAKTFNSDNFGIPIPTNPILTTDDQIQVVFVPLLAYDYQGNRIGYGKGYYDGYLSKISDSTLKIGLSFFLPFDSLPVESHDIPLDMCITADRIYNFSTGQGENIG